MMRKKSIAVLSAGALALILTACGGSAESNSESPDPTPATGSSIDAAETTSETPTTSDVPTTNAQGDGTSTNGEGSRESPWAAGTPVPVYNTDNVAEIVIGDADWNANGLVETATEVGASAPDGFVYVLVPVTVTLVESESAQATPANYTFSLSYVTPDGQSFREIIAGYPDSLSSQPELYPGATATGNLLFELPVDAQGGVWAIEDWLQASGVPGFVAAS